MDEGGRENRRQRVDYYKVPPWNVMSHYQIKEQNSFHMNAKISMLCDEKNAAIKERDRAVAEKKVALDERDIAIEQRDAAIVERDSALRERNNAIAALQFHEHNDCSIRRVTTDGSKAEWDSQDCGSMDQIRFDESTMPVPFCSCTGVPRQCYKWGSGGWQSSCCTTALSVYPLPQMPNKRHARMGGRKMSGSVFSRLLTRLAAAGRDLSVPLDLKNYWAKHGTNRYITIK
ncbi:hypothetical protein DH2020_045353 [Rehmannia glutinosa]|uniref:GAGA-binding transcriptional activator n=1 Tax=Rehmannia glutinosa TaxID=99300 RepID=A0ABR0UG35_REHGL